MIKEFKKFISRGNVMDMAVGVIIGAAFTAIVQSLVKNLINPLLGIFAGKIVFKVGDATFKYGSFINSVINFLIISFVVFLMIKALNKVMPKKEKEAGPTETDYLEEIRDLLKKQVNQNK